MKSGWPIVRLGELLTRRKDEIAVQPMEFYSRLTIRMNGKGIVIRDRVQGHQIGTKNQFVTKTGQLVLSKIDARNGAFGVLPDECDSAIITGNFWAFEANRDRLDVRYLNYLTKTPLFIDFCIRASDGTTNRLYLQEPKFLAREIPLPAVTEQRRIVARIEQLAAQIEAARRLRHQATEETGTLISSALASIFADAEQKWSPEPLGSRVEIQGGFAFKSDEYIETGLPIVRISNLEDEIVHVNDSPCMPQSRFEEFARFSLRGGDILIAMTGATTGKLGIVPDTCDRWLLNQRVGRFLPKNRDSLEPKYVYWLARGVQKKVFETAYGGAQPNISPRDIESMEFPFPPATEQRQLVAYLDGLAGQVARLARLQTETAAELDALLPSILDKAFKGEL